MKRNLKKLITKAGAPVTLTEAERAHMRFVLGEYAALKPIREAPVPANVVFGSGWYSYLRRPIGIATAALLFLALSSGGVAYAAEGALPGNALYPVKVDLIEPLQVALAVSPQTKASLQMAFAEQRIVEAARAAQNGKLNAATEAALAANFAKNAAGAVAAAKESTRSSTTTNLLTTGFTDRLAAYENVLALVGRGSVDARAITRLQKTIQMQISSMVGTEKNAETVGTTSPQRVAPTRASLEQQNVLRLQYAADTALGVSAQVVGTASHTLDASSSASAQEEFAQASALAEQGRTLLRRHDENGAARAFQAALSATARLDVLTRAAATLKLPVFAEPPMLSSTTVQQETASSSASSKESASVRIMPGHKDGGFPFGL